MNYRIFDYDPYLKPFAADIDLRMKNYLQKKKEVLANEPMILDIIIP